MHPVFHLIKFRVPLILGLTVLAAALLVPGFFSLTTLGLGLDRSSSMGLVAVGLTALLIAGQIDLSGGAVFALSGIVAIELQPLVGLGWGAVAGVVVGGICGAVNGTIAVVFRVNSLVATLATMLIFRSVAHWLTDSQPTSGLNIMFSLKITQVYAEIFTIRSALFVLSILALHVWLTRTASGRNLFAVGSNPAAAEASGISANKTVFLTYIFASAMAGLAGVFQSLATNTGSPMFGSELTIAVIAAVVVGGTRLEGGVGSALGTLGGVLTIATLTTAMEFQSAPAYVQQVVIGAILILLVVLERAMRLRGPAQKSANIRI